MINLLPQEKKRDIRAARTNVLLARYNLVALGLIAILGAFCLILYILLHNSQTKALSTTADNAQRAASLNDVRVAADNYRSDLSFAKQIIGKSVNYTDMIIAITKLMPDGAILDRLDIKSSDLGQKTQFQGHAVSYAVAEQLKQNFQTSKLFSNVYFDVLTLKTDTGSDKIASKYPVTVSMNAKFNTLGAAGAK